MAQEEVFAGPMSESIPSSVTGFAHRRPRADSIASFAYFQEDDESPEWSDDQAVADGASGIDFGVDGQNDLDTDVELGYSSSRRRKSSGYSRSSVDQPLLHRLDSSKSDASMLGQGTRSRQKIYVASEDLTIVIAGFSTNWFGFAIYVSLCIMSAGLLYLLFRWMPRWWIRLTGSETSLRECEWVVIEVSWMHRLRKSEGRAKKIQNQWGEFQVHNVSKIPYGYAVSSVFEPNSRRSSSYEYDEDDDPVMPNLRVLDYRYIRFYFHPLKDKFVICSNWKDPEWIDAKSMRIGLDGDERARRETVFDKNQIDIQEKSIFQLLVDEVCPDSRLARFLIMFV